MTKRLPKEKVNIRPGVSILSVLSRLNYKPWYALAEFVDNSLQSFLDHKSQLKSAGAKRLRVEITIFPHDKGRITIRDNAAGIGISDFPRAFRPAEIPSDTSGLHEYGMGMKCASCWFAKEWSVRTSALGDPYIRTVTFDIDKIVDDKIEELDVEVEAAQKQVHFTEITLRSLNRVPKGKTLGKIKDHLASIYRHYINEGLLELIVDDEVLEYKTPNILKAPYHKEEKGKHILWKIPIDISMGSRKRVHGFAALREVGSVSEAGFALFRKRRLIQGSADEGYRPEVIFGKPNSYTYQRLFGELHLDGFDVSHTKDGFVWQEQEEDLVAKLSKIINGPKRSLGDQAEGHRARPPKEKFEQAAPKLMKTLANDLSTKSLSDEVNKKKTGPPPSQTPPPKLPPKKTDSQVTETIELVFRDEKWVIKIDVVNNPVVRDFVEVSDLKGTREVPRKIGIRMSTCHSFIQKYVGTDLSMLEPFIKIAVSLVLAETAAREGGTKNASVVRSHFNDILRKTV